MLADGVSLASVFDKLKSTDGQGCGNGRIDFDRSRQHEQRSIVRCVALDVPAGDLQLARVFKFLHNVSPLRDALGRLPRLRGVEPNLLDDADEAIAGGFKSLQKFDDAI
jgi:hypothetical protein